jgi:hypothetical protein
MPIHEPIVEEVTADDPRAWYNDPRDGTRKLKAKRHADIVAQHGGQEFDYTPGDRPDVTVRISLPRDKHPDTLYLIGVKTSYTYEEARRLNLRDPNRK